MLLKLKVLRRKLIIYDPMMGFLRPIIFCAKAVESTHSKFVLIIQILLLLNLSQALLSLSL